MLLAYDTIVCEEHPTRISLREPRWPSPAARGH